MKTDLLILLHEPETTAGTTDQWCAQRNITYKVHLVYTCAPLPPLASFESLLICGGDMDTDQEVKYPWLISEKKFIAAVLKAGKNVVGLCLGAQLLAQQLGAEVSHQLLWEIGWYPVQTELLPPDTNSDQHSNKISNQNSSLTSDQTSSITPFHWHRSTFGIPKGSRRIATNPNCQNQGFQMKTETGGLITGLQFHAEMDEFRLEKSVENLNITYIGHVQSKKEIYAQAPKNLEAIRSWYFQLLDSVLIKHGPGLRM